MSKFIRKSIQTMEGYVPGEQPKCANIIKLNTNENPYPPTPKIAELLAKFDIAELRKYPNPVSQKLREALAKLHHCSIDQIFVGNGSDEVLALCIRAFVERDTGSVSYFDPSYSLYPILADIEDVEKRPVDLDEKFDWQMPENHEASLFFLTNPNAPTSLTFEKSQIREFISNFKGVVLVDEAYADFSDFNCMDFAKEFETALSVARSANRFHLRSDSATALDQELIGAMYKIKDSYNIDMITQEIACGY